MADTNATAVIYAGAWSLNELPEEILTYILSFLSTKSAVQTSLVCRKWRNLWCRLSSLHFPYTATIIPRSIVDFVSQTLIHRSSTSAPDLHKFHLEFDFKGLYSSHVDSWIRYAIHHHVRELELDFFISREFQSKNSDDIEPVYDFPFFLLKHGRIEVLKLTKCDITLPNNVASMGLDSLRSVNFDQVNLSDEMVSNLVSGCGNLECLSLEYCYGMKDMKFFSLKLKSLSLNYFACDDGSIEICCPKLVSLEMIGFLVEKYDFKDLSSLVEAVVAFLHMLKYYKHWSQVVKSLVHVKRLTVQNWWFKLLDLKDAFFRSAVFYNLRHLELRTEYSKSDVLGIAALIELSPNLETLILDYLCKIDKDEGLSDELLNKPINLTLANLRVVEIRDFRETEEVNFFLSLLFEHGVVLEKIVLVPPRVGGAESSVLILHKSPQVQF